MAKNRCMKQCPAAWSTLLGLGLALQGGWWGRASSRSSCSRGAPASSRPAAGSLMRRWTLRRATPSCGTSGASESQQYEPRLGQPGGPLLGAELGSAGQGRAVQRSSRAARQHVSGGLGAPGAQPRRAKELPISLSQSFTRSHQPECTGMAQARPVWRDTGRGGTH